MDYTKFSCTFTVRRLLRDDIPSIFALCEKNPQFYEHCPPFVTPEKIEADMKAMPQRPLSGCAKWVHRILYDGKSPARNWRRKLDHH